MVKKKTGAPFMGPGLYRGIIIDILHHVNEMDSNSYYIAMGSTSSRVPAGSCFRQLMPFDPQAIPVCPTVGLSHWFSKQFPVLNDTNYEISLFNL
jgi:hypothetical protein